MAILPCPDCNSQISTRAFDRALLWLIAIGIGIALMGLAAAILHLNFR